MSYVMYNLTYLFSVLCLVLMVMFMMLVYMSSMIYIKYLIILVYISGVVVFILYISCMCWNVKSSFISIFLFFALFFMVMYDSGLVMKVSDVGEYFWVYLFFSVLFSLLVTIYSLNLFKSNGSLRF